jgi:hypothetical protein
MKDHENCNEVLAKTRGEVCYSLMKSVSHIILYSLTQSLADWYSLVVLYRLVQSHTHHENCNEVLAKTPGEVCYSLIQSVSDIISQ